MICDSCKRETPTAYYHAGYPMCATCAAENGVRTRTHRPAPTPAPLPLHPISVHFFTHSGTVHFLDRIIGDFRIGGYEKPTP